MNTLEFKWTVSKARDSYGYNICTLLVDGRKVARCNGGGYDMEGTVLGDWFAKAYASELLKIDREFYGLTFHDPNFNPGEAVLPNGKTVEQAEKDGDSLGLDRYQQFYKASNKTPTELHIIPLIDGACGFSSVQRIIEHLGHKLQMVHNGKNLTVYTFD